MGQFVENIAEGDNLTGSLTLADDTICQYLRAATSWLRLNCDVIVPLYSNEGGSRKTEKLHPYISELLGQRRTWAQKNDKKEPLTGRILSTMGQLADEAKCGPQGELSMDCVLYDCCRLGIFTGSRLAEYGQGALPRNAPTDGWLPLPSSRDVPKEWRGKPCAFVASDFEFYNAHRTLVAHSDVKTGREEAVFVHVRFRYDKSNHNFTIRKYKQVTENPVCPVAAARSFIRRGPKILVNEDEPLAMFRAKNGRRHTVRGKHIQDFMRRACIRAHPDENHYLRRRINRLLTHSLRVTAAVALYNAGVDIDDISFRLRWNSDAVKLYIRDCYRTIGALTSRALAGAFADV